ncbi:P-loop containing nucleoside triphosphate hydrolase protein [Obelidium mucronatum]|nr:P-loop containing nucleoside triphosphate hydrolase protein [Obelidium mucronatum]
MTLSGANKIDITDPKGEKGSKPFHFDTVFGMDTEQEAVYGIAVEPLIRKCLDGYNGCIFAYGQTAAGKTHTMQGPNARIAESLSDSSDSIHPEIGIISRVVHQLHEHVKEHRGKVDEASGNCLDFVIKVSYLEIYNEGLVDLLVDKNKQEDLKIRMESGSTTGKDLYVQNLSERYISSMKDYFKVLTTGAKNRSVGETNMNAQSSRSHAILTITVDQYLVQPKKPAMTAASSEASLSRSASSTSLAPEISSLAEHSPEMLQKIGQGRKRSKIHLIDLAGSERADSTGATGDRLKEGAQINQSLSALGNVISALTSPTKGSSKPQHIPYRDSKLTYLLSDSLGGNALTLMITCCSPTAKNYSESLSTLRFAERVKKVVNKAVVNMDPYLLRIAELEAENLVLKKQIENCVCNSQGSNGNDEKPKSSTARASVETKNQEQQTEIEVSVEPPSAISNQQVKNQEQQTEKGDLDESQISEANVAAPSMQTMYANSSTSPMTPAGSVPTVSNHSIGIQTDPWLLRAVYQLHDWGVI